MVDSADQAVARVVVTDVSVIRLSEADDQLARDEGEGFRDVGDWRAAHQAFWRTYVLPELPKEIALDDEPQVVVERFKLIAGSP